MCEYRNMHENLEHDRMIFSNYDRQSIAFLKKTEKMVITIFLMIQKA